MCHFSHACFDCVYHCFTLPTNALLYLLIYCSHHFQLVLRESLNHILYFIFSYPPPPPMSFEAPPMAEHPGSDGGRSYPCPEIQRSKHWRAVRITSSGVGKYLPVRLPGNRPASGGVVSGFLRARCISAWEGFGPSHPCTACRIPLA